jgi:hypothetical protein
MQVVPGLAQIRDDLLRAPVGIEEKQRESNGEQRE